jgi:ABC-type glycerol-3-phosphate transport system substrate-binding protein
LAVWTGAEEAQFRAVLAAFTARTGASVQYLSAAGGVPAALDGMLARHAPPDVAFLPQPGLLRQYARSGRLVALDRIAGPAVARNYTAVWRDLGSEGGPLYGVWFKAANKSLVWYNIAAFQRAGVVPPADVEGWLRVADALVASGTGAFAVGGADGWPLTDWFENLYLRLAGPARYDQLAVHAIPWTDATVKETLTLLGRILSPRLVAGGVAAAAQTTYLQSVADVFGSVPSAAMTMEGDFVAGAISGETPSLLGVDADAFSFPAVRGSAPAIVGGGDVAVLLRDSPAGEALLRFLATPQAAAVWAAHGGFISPNTGLGLSVYPDVITRSAAAAVMEAGDEFRFDLSDLQPTAFGGTRGAGMQRELAAFLVHRDVDQTALRLEEAARTAYGP